MPEDPAYSKGGDLSRVFRASGYKNPPLKCKDDEVYNPKTEKCEKKEEKKPKESATPKFDKLLGELTYGYKPGELEDCVRKCMAAYRARGLNERGMPHRELVKHCLAQCTANRR